MNNQTDISNELRKPFVQTIYVSQKEEADRHLKNIIPEHLAVDRGSPQFGTLVELENRIECRINGQYEIGEALEKIKQQGLYKLYDGIETFEEYCKIRFKISRTYSFYLRRYFKIHTAICGDDGPGNKIPEYHIRLFENMKINDVKNLWKKAKRLSEGHNPDYETLKQVVDEFNEISKTRRNTSHTEPTENCSAESVIIYSKILKKRYLLSEIGNPVNFIEEKAGNSTEKLIGVFCEFKDACNFSLEDKTHLKNKIQVLQDEQMQRFVSEASL